MEDDRRRLVCEKYRESDATVRIGGITKPQGAATYAFGRVSRRLPVEFLVLGANASHQAAKAMADLRQLVRMNSVAPELAFIVRRVMINATDRDDRTKTNEREALVWKAVVIAQPEE